MVYEYYLRRLVLAKSTHWKYNLDITYTHLILIKKMEQIILVSDGLRLRMIEFSGLDSIHKLHSMPETDQYNTLGIPKDKNETKTVIEPWVLENLSSATQNYTFAIEKIEN